MNKSVLISGIIKSHELTFNKAKASAYLVFTQRVIGETQEEAFVI